MKSISSSQLRELYQKFFEGKGHVRIPSAPLVPENDPSVLFTTAGMHPLVSYLKGQPHPAGKRLTNVQKCLRTTDIDAVGDATHATVFEMLGNWSLGDYFKEEAIAWSWEFLTSADCLNIAPDYLAVSVFGGDAGIPRDDESARIWSALGVPKERIAYLGSDDNWWPAGGQALGPQGPDTEMFYWTGGNNPPRRFDPADPRWVEIWNDVFMQYNRASSGALEELSGRNVDTGMGIERTVMALAGVPSIYDIDSYQPLMQLVRERTHHADSNEIVRHQRILADHLKAAVFVLADEHPVTPAKTERGYVLRRLIRRAIRSARMLDIEAVSVMRDGLELLVGVYGAAYPTLARQAARAWSTLKQEIERFEATLSRGLKEFERAVRDKSPGEDLAGRDAWRLYETYGFPIELTEELAREGKFGVDRRGFEEARGAHRARSKHAAAGKFSGGLADHSAQAIKYHTATHLLHQALRDVLGAHVLQRGSNITRERLRFDFSHPVALTRAQLAAVEHVVNQRIAENLPVRREAMTVREAQQRGALGLFTEKYGELVSVYSIGDYSREICGGPHVARTGEIGHFRITKEESAGAGVRRVRAVVEET